MTPLAEHAVAWFAQLASSIIVVVVTVSLNRKVSESERRSIAEQERTEEKRRADAKWRDGIERKFAYQDAKLESIAEATQANMRAQLVHLFEKYYSRGWVTPEERRSWYDMHDRYSAMGFNGYIDTYRKKLDEIPDRELS